jgi:protein O-mannosyl-transferase
MSVFTDRAKTLIICALLSLTTLWLYWPVRDYGFVFDDSIFVTDNRMVQSGLNSESVRWIFSSTFTTLGSVVWLSHMLDCHLFGMNAGAHHMTGITIHIANSILLFLLLRSLTTTLWRPAFVAMLFAIHPMRIESVAWIAERRDVLSMFFFLLTLMAYTLYAKRRSYLAYAAALLLFAVGLVCKQIVVTLPCVLLLLDFWPLKRLSLPEWNRGGKATKSVTRPVNLMGIVLEKLPFLAMTAAVSLATLVNPEVRSEISAMEGIPMALRIQNAFISYIRYLAKLFWPVDLAVLYPYPDSWPLAYVAGSVLCLSAITALVLCKIRRHPYLSIGWFWYLGTSVPIIGLLQLGRQSIADRYTYLPFIGLFIMVAWGVGHYVSTQNQRRAATLGAMAVFAACLIGTRAELPYWKNNETLFARALAVTTDNEVAYTNLGKELFLLGKRAEGRQHCIEALRINPKSVNARNNLGVDYYESGEYEKAIEHFQVAIDVAPNGAIALNSMGNALNKLGRFQEAIKYFRKSIEAKPDYPEAHLSLGVALDRTDQLDEAIREYFIAIQLRPDYAKAYNNLGNTLSKQNRLDEAVVNYNRALKLNPKDASIYNNLAVVLERLDRLVEATPLFREALRLDPAYDTAQSNLANNLYKLGQTSEALDLYARSLEKDPGNVNTRYNLALLLQQKGRAAEALEHLELLLKSNPNHLGARLNAGNLCYAAEKLEAARTHFSEAIRLAPDNLVAHNNLGNVFDKLGDSESAKTHYREVLRIDPRQPDGYNNLGFVLAKEGQLAEAVAIFDQALALKPDFATASSNRAAALALLKKQQAAQTNPAGQPQKPAP